ncbi:hypothetical protein KKA53_04820 [Candidatus Dependentiae bacterium]|nr:hypothetical protein [Candidatus Dependentiae bacterium]
MTDKGLECLAKGCQNLKELDLSSCRKITDRGLEILKSTLPNLKVSI